MTVNERVKEFIELNKISQSDLAKVILIKPQQVTNWFTQGERVPEKALVRMIENYKELNARWLITGEGEMLEGSVHLPQIVAEPKVDYGDCMARLEAKAEECGRLKAVNQFLTEEISQLKGISGREPVGRRARAG